MTSSMHRELFFKKKTAYEIPTRDWSSDVCSSDLKNEADIGHTFGNWFELQGNGKTDSAPVATRVGNSLFVFIKGLDGRIYLNQAEYQHGFSGWFEVGGGIY